MFRWLFIARGATDRKLRSVNQKPTRTKAFSQGTDKGFVRILFKTEPGKERVKGTGKDDKVIHIADIVNSRETGKVNIGLREVKCCRQRAY